MRSLLGIWILMLSLPAVADESVSAKIVSIYRPLEMESRRVRVERKVFIQSESELDFPEKLVGQTLTVFRLRKVPAQVNMKPSTSVVEVPEPPMTGSTLRTEHNEKGKRLAPLEGGRPAGFAAPSERSLTKVPVHLGAETTHHDLVRRVSAPPLKEHGQEQGRSDKGAQRAMSRLQWLCRTVMKSLMAHRLERWKDRRCPLEILPKGLSKRSSQRKRLSLYLHRRKRRSEANETEFVA